MYAGKKLKQIRLHLGLKQDVMADKLGVSQSFYSAMERGKKPLSGKTIEKIQSYWGINIENFEGVNDKDIRGNYEGVNEGVNAPKTQISVSPLQMEVFKIIEKYPELEGLNVNIRKVALFSMVSDYISDKYFSPVIKHAGENIDFKDFIQRTHKTLSGYKKFAPAFAKLAKAMETFEKEMYKAGDKFFEYTDEAFIEKESKYDEK